MLLSCRGIKKSFRDLDVLKGVDFDINEGERVGLVGVNGAGKTTLAGLVFGSIIPDEGVVRYGSRGLTVGWLLQSSSGLIKRGEGEPEILTEGNGETPEEADNTGASPFDTLSGGERIRFALKRLLSERLELLLLDEPTNHLDFAGVEWLASELSGYKGTIIVISHDRYFIDLAVDRIIELENGLAKSYGGNYSYYRQQKKREYEEQLHQYIEQEKRKDMIEAEIERTRKWAAKSHREAGEGSDSKFGTKEFYRTSAKRMDKRVKSKIKRLQRMETEGVKKPAEEVRMNFAFDDAGKHGKRILEAKDLRKGYNGRILFKDSSFYMLHGDRTGVVGPNGCGKTTLLRLITGGEEADAGELWISPTSGAVYISQDVRDLDPEKRPADLVEGIQGLIFNESRKVFASLGISAPMLMKRLGALSQGERMRVKLAAAILKGSGFLILDEPTNHLDLYSRERLEDALDEYEGTILLVSHDRYLLERVCDRLLVFEGGMIRPFYGKFGEYAASAATKVKSEPSEKKSKPSAEERLLIENRMTVLLGKLSSAKQDDPVYAGLDAEFRELVQRKRRLGF